MGKYIAALMVALLLLWGIGLAEQAEDITALCEITSPGKTTDTVHDGLYTSFWRNREMKEGYLEFRVPEGKTARWLYICFGEEGNQWEIQHDISGRWETLLSGQYDYAHVLLDLGSETHFRLVETSGKKAQFKINEVYVFGDGILPDWVQQWEPSLEKADILLLAAHPDDELLFFGGTIPDYGVERGTKVAVAYMSYSNTTRKSELLNGLWSMGIRNYPYIGTFHDSYSSTLEDAYSRWNKQKVDAYVTELIRKVKPAVLLSHDVNGEYGHGAHKLCADAAVRCAENAGNPDFYSDSAEQYGVWTVQKVYLHLAKEGTIFMNWRVPLSSQEGRTGLEAAALAYTYHVTQQTTRFEVTDEGKNSCAEFGLVYSLVGPDEVGDDFLEHITTLSSSKETATVNEPEESGERMTSEPDENGENDENPALSQETADPAEESETTETFTQEDTEDSLDKVTESLTSLTEVPEAGEAEASEAAGKDTDEQRDSELAESEAESAMPGTSVKPTVLDILPVTVDGNVLPAERKPYADVTWPEQVEQVSLDEQGYPVSGEIVYADDENGCWFYASPTLVVRIDRIYDEETYGPKEMVTWYEAHIFCDLDQEQFGSILYNPEKPQAKHVQPKLIARENQVVFAMNTDYYTYRMGRKTVVGMIIRDRKVFFDRVPDANRRQFPNLDTLAMYEDGHWEVHTSNELTAEEYLEAGAVDVYAFGPYLVRDGEINPFVGEMTNGKTPQPRCAIGMIAPGHYYAILAEGRMRNISVGVDIQFLADHMLVAGCEAALNLDGGQTAVMCFMGEQITRIGKYDGGKTSPRATTELMGIGHSDMIDPTAK
ncbi:MAG: phosphodiester glycosidase family protein [Clostridia bacterium]|nr:phosphodiester glycosidase family protein [Clostridia bacterium]